MWSKIESLSHEFTVGRQTMLNVSKHVSQWYREKMSPHNRSKHFLFQKGMPNRRELRQGSNTSLPKIGNSPLNKEYCEKGGDVKQRKKQSKKSMEWSEGNIGKDKSLTERVDSFIRSRKRQILMSRKLENFEVNMPPKQVHKRHVKLIKGSTYSQLNKEIIEQMRSMHFTRESHQSQLHDLRRKRLGLRK